MTRRRNKRRNPVRRVRRRRNPSTRLNPHGGISSMLMGGVYIGAGMWLGGIINGLIPSFGGGMIMEIARGGLSAYAVGMIAGRFTGQAGLMAAGAFAPTAMGIISSVIGGSGLSLGNLFGGGGKQVHSPVNQQIPTAPATAPGGNVVPFSQAG